MKSLTSTPALANRSSSQLQADGMPMVTVDDAPLRRVAAYRLSLGATPSPKAAALICTLHPPRKIPSMAETHLPAKSSDTAAAVIPQSAQQCLGCSPSNPQGLHLPFLLDSSYPDRITSRSVLNLTRLHEGGLPAISIAA